jgi:hypothetical protein
MFKQSFSVGKSSHLAPDLSGNIYFLAKGHFKGEFKNNIPMDAFPNTAFNSVL